MARNASMTCSTGADCACETPASQSAGASRAGAWTYRPAVDVIETPDAYRIVADAPGSSAERVGITFEDGVLTVDAAVEPRANGAGETHRVEYGVGSFHRRFRVHGEIDADSIGASYANGVLTVTLPKARRARPRKIPVSAG